jgi:hypothetical protein
MVVLLLLLVVPLGEEIGGENKRGKSHGEANPIGSARHPRKWPHVCLSHTNILHNIPTKTGRTANGILSVAFPVSHHIIGVTVLFCMMMRNSIVRWRWVKGQLFAFAFCIHVPGFLLLFLLQACITFLFLCYPRYHCVYYVPKQCVITYP